MLSVIASNGDVFQFLLQPSSSSSGYSFLDVGKSDPDLVLAAKPASRPLTQRIARTLPVPKPYTPSIYKTLPLVQPITVPKVAVVPVQLRPVLIAPIQPVLPTPVQPISVAVSERALRKVVIDPTRTVLSENQAQAWALYRGLMVAKSKKQIGYRSTVWNQVNDMVTRLKLGDSMEIAAKRTQVPMALAMQLVQWGQG